jgi:deoxycytidylate deaminase
MSIQHAIKIAQRSTNRTHRTGAVITDKHGQFISAGWSHQSQHIYVQTPRSMHAEMHAIIRARPGSLRDAVIYVATLTGRGNNITMSRPCKVCESLLDHVGINTVHWTVGGTNGHHH